MEVAPDKARKRRQDAQQDARVERWAEDSGNAALAGRARPRRREPGRAGVQLHSRARGRPAGRAGDLAAAHPRTRTRPDRRAALPGHPGLATTGSRPRGITREPGCGTWPGSGTPPNGHMAGLPPARQPVRLRAQHPLRPRRPDLPVQRRPAVQAITAQVVRSAPEVEPGQHDQDNDGRFPGWPGSCCGSASARTSPTGRAARRADPGLACGGVQRLGGDCETG